MQLINLVLIGLLYQAYPDGCQYRFTNLAEAKALTREGASALVMIYAMHQSRNIAIYRVKQASVTQL